MKYDEIRDLVRTGDVIAIRKRHGFLPTLTRWVTRSPYTHTAIALWVEVGGVDRLLVTEAKASGAFMAPLSQYAGVDFDVFDAPRLSIHLIEQAIWSTLGQPIAYDFLDLLRIGVNRLFGIPLPDHDDESMVCSALSAFILMRAGWQPIGGLPSLPAPDDVVAALVMPPRWEVRPPSGIPAGHA